jgi:malonyl-CoA/methylmalonyl-CoA synthetase
VSDALSTPAVVEASRAGWERHLGTPPPENLRTALAAGSIALAAHETALAVPSRPAVQVDGASFTHGELDERAARMAGWLRRRGVEPGDVVLISSPSSLALVVVYLGGLRAGATLVLANPVYTEPELEHLVSDSQAVMALGAGQGLVRLGAIAERRTTLRVVVDAQAATNDLADSPALEPAPADPGRPALLAYTSGTTGTPKTVPLMDGNILASTRAIMLAWRWRSEDVLVHALPLFHQHGLGGLHTALLSGSRAVIQSRFAPHQVCRAIETARGSVLFAVPSMYARLADWGGEGLRALRSLRLLASGSAPLSPQLAERISDLAGQPPLERFGTTESGLDVSNPYEGERVPGMVGLPLPGIDLAIADEHGEALDPGHDGEIAVRGPQVFSGYRGAPEATAEAFYPGGWFRTGDVGRVDPGSGYLQITGRTRELIISGGMNVYPREVEFALEAHPSVARAAVVGVPSERWGEEVVAVVVPAGRGDGPRDDELLQFARSRLAPYKCPKRVVFVPELPVNAMGKTLAAEVRKLF